MKQRKMLALTLYQLGQLYRHELPELVAAAEASGDAVQFRRRLGEWVSRSESAQGDAGEQIRLLIDYDGRRSMNCLPASGCRCGR